MDDHTAVEHVEKPLHFKIAIGHLRSVSLGGLDLAAVVLRLEKLLPHDGRRLRAAAGKRRLLLGVGAVGHFHAGENPAVGGVVEKIVDRLRPAKLGVDRLSTEQVAGARHDVERGEPAGPALAEAGVADIDRVENPHVGLHGAAGVAAPASAHVAVGVDQARHDHLAGCVDPLGVGRNRRGRRGADGGDFSVGHHHHSGRDRGS